MKLAKTSGSGFVKISGWMVGYISCAMMAALTSKWPLSQTLTIRPCTDNKVKRKRIKRHDIHLTSDHAWTEAFVADTEYPAHEVQQFPRAARPLSLSVSLSKKMSVVFYRCGCFCFDLAGVLLFVFRNRNAQNACVRPCERLKALTKKERAPRIRTAPLYFPVHPRAW